MKKSVTAILLSFISLTTFSLIALAEDSQSNREWVGGLGFLSLSEDIDKKSIELGAIVGSLGYKINIHDNFYLIPEVRVGLGAGSNSVSDSKSIGNYKEMSKLEAEIDSLVAFSVRGQFKFKSGIYLYAAPTYSRGSFSYTLNNVGQYGNESPSTYVYSDNESRDDITVTAGIGCNLGEIASAELSYEKFEGSEVTSLGIKYNF